MKNQTRDRKQKNEVVNISTLNNKITKTDKYKVKGVKCISIGEVWQQGTKQ